MKINTFLIDCQEIMFPNTFAYVGFQFAVTINGEMRTIARHCWCNSFDKSLQTFYCNITDTDVLFIE